jgi:hypothetical protein
MTNRPVMINSGRYRSPLSKIVSPGLREPEPVRPPSKFEISQPCHCGQAG